MSDNVFCPQVVHKHFVYFIDDPFFECSFWHQEWWRFLTVPSFVFIGIVKRLRLGLEELEFDRVTRLQTVLSRPFKYRMSQFLDRHTVFHPKPTNRQWRNLFNPPPPLFPPEVLWPSCQGYTGSYDYTCRHQNFVDFVLCRYTVGRPTHFKTGLKVHKIRFQCLKRTPRMNVKSKCVELSLRRRLIKWNYLRYT